MSSIQKNVTISLVKRPWYEWALWALWVVLEIFIVQNALASTAELEPRAALLFWITFVVLLAGGVIVWFVRHARLAK